MSEETVVTDAPEVQGTEAAVETQSTETKETKVEETTEAKETSTDESLLGKTGEVAKEVPEKYEFNLPEGMEMDTVMVEKAEPLFKDLGLSQEQADKVVELYAGQIQTQAEAYQKTIEGWKDETIKTLGSTWQAELSVATRFIDKYGTEEVRTVLNDTGLGNHPEVVKMFIKAGKAFGNDSFPTGTNKNTPTDPERAARKMFPNTKYD